MFYFALHTGQLVEIRRTVNPANIRVKRSTFRVNVKLQGPYDYYSGKYTTVNKTRITKLTNYSGGKLLGVLYPGTFARWSGTMLPPHKAIEITKEVSQLCLEKGTFK